jgi:hypothetical protein
VPPALEDAEEEADADAAAGENSVAAFDAERKSALLPPKAAPASSGSAGGDGGAPKRLALRP